MGLMARWGYKQPELHESALLAAVPASYTGAAAEGTTEALSGAKTPRKDTYGLQAGFTQLPGRRAGSGGSGSGGSNARAAAATCQMALRYCVADPSFCVSLVIFR